MKNKETYVETVKLARTIEAALEILVKLFGLWLVYQFGSYVMDSSEAENTLFSILLLPALLILKDGHIILEPFTIKTYITDNDVIVKSGLLTRTTDKLNIKTLENIELVKSPMARLPSPFWKSYGTLNLYAYGGTVIMPYLENPEKVQKDIEEILNKIKQQNNNQPNEH
jgi:hypothetical protein